MKKSIVALLLAVCMVFTCFTFTAVAEEPVTITWLMHGVGTTPNDENPVLDAIAEKTGVKIQLIPVSDADLQTKLNTMIVGGKLPDIISRFGLADATEFRDEGALLELDDLLTQYGSNILAETSGSLYSAPLNKDGTVYGLIRGRQGYTRNLCIRKDWLEKVGLDTPTDLESLYNVLYAFTYNDPDGNGQNDTVGYAFCMGQVAMLSYIFGAYGINTNADAGSYVELEDGTVTTYMKHPKYLEVINYLRRLYKDGILFADFATAEPMTCHELLWTGRLGIYDFVSTGTVQNWYPGRYTFEVPEDPADMWTYTTIAGPDGLDGTYKIYPNMLQYDVITSTCEHPEAAMKLLDFLYSPEGDILTNLGVQGLMWDWVDETNGKYTRLGKYTDDATHRAEGGFSYWDEGYIQNNIEVKLMRKITQESQAYGIAHSFEYPYILSTLSAAVEYGTVLDDITKEALVTLITTDGDVEAEYAQFVDRWNNAGGLELEAEATEVYKAQK